MRKNILKFKQMKINHPRNYYEKEYDSAKAWCEQQEMEDLYIESYDGLKLHAGYFPAENAERIVLLSHGYKGSCFGSIAYIAHFLHDNNCDLLFIDQRGCGKSEGTHVTFGVKEQYDVLKWLKLISRKNVKKLPIYLYGQSMGATTILLASGHKLPHEVAGLIADCGFHSMKKQMKDIASKWFHLKWNRFILFRIDFYCRLLAGFRMKDSDTTEALQKNSRPILFFHGEADTYVFPDNTLINYRLCRAQKEMVMIPSAKHLCSSYAEPEIYQNRVIRFFKKYDRSISD